MQLRLARLLAVAVALGCGADRAPAIFSIDIGASGGGPLLVTALGGTLQLVATPRDTAGRPVTGASIAWSSGNASVATVDASGLVTAVANGTVDLSVSAGTALGRATLTVAQAPGSVAITPPSASVERGATASFRAAVVDSRGNAVTGAVVRWASLDAAIASVSADGVATGAATGNTTLTATAGDRSATASLVVMVPSASAVAISATETSALTSLDDLRQLGATATDARGAPIPEAAFAWASSDPSVVRVDDSGLVTAVKNGAATVTATSGTAQGSLALSVAQATHTVAISPSAQAIAPDALFAFTAQPLDAHAHPVASPPAASWTIDDPTVATIDAATGQVHGSADATAVATTHVHAAVGGVTGTAEVTLDPAMAPVETVSLPQPAGPLGSLGDTLQLTATALNHAGKPVPGVAFSWSSDDPAVATVAASSGLVTASGNGSATITASGGGRSATASVSVLQLPARLVLTPPASPTLTSFDDTLQLSAAVEDARGHAIAGAPLAWSTSDASIVAVSNTGLATAKGNGAAVTITVTSGSLHDEVVLAVAQAVHAVNVTPSSDSIPPHTAIDFTAAGLDAHGHLVSGAPAASWTSGDAGVTIDGAGHAVAGSFAAAQVVTITATIAGVSGTAALTIDPALVPVDHVVVAGGGVSLASFGATAQLSAQAQDASGAPLSGHPINWAVQDGSADVVTVGPTGLVTAVGNGQKAVVASAGGVSGTTAITVAQVLTSVHVSTQVAAASATLTSLGDTLALQAQGLDARGHALPAGAAFTWRSDSAAASVDPAGLVTALADGAAQLFAKAGDVESAGFGVTVAQAVDRIAVSAGGAETTLRSLGDTLQLSASAVDARGNPVAATFTWSPTSGAAAIVDAATGLVTAASNGTTSVQAAAGGKTGALTVTVAQVIASVAVAGPATLASLGETAQLSALAADANGRAVPGAVFSWRSDSASVTVAVSGVITAVANGAANLFAKTGTVESPGHAVAVAQVVASISISGATSLASLGDTTQLGAAGLDANANPVGGLVFTWSVLDGSSDVVTIDSSTGLVTAVANGQETVVASAGGRSGSQAITVAQVPASVVASAAGPTALHSLGDSVQLAASAADANGHAIPGASFTWRSDNPAAATISSPGGLVTAAGNGTANLFAKAGTVESAALGVTVAQVVASVVVSPANPTIKNGATLQLSADPRDARGNHASGAPAASWQSSNPSVAAIDASTGLATGSNPGLSPLTATLTATIAGASGSTLATVTGAGY